MLRHSVFFEGPKSKAEAQIAYEGEGNIVGVGIGLLDENSAGLSLPPGSPVLNVYVAEPTSTDQVKTVLVESMGIPTAGQEDVPVNVIVTGEIDALPHRGRYRPTPGGVSVGHYKITAGTLGCLARGKTGERRRRVLILSNNHVLANSNSGKYGDPILQPGSYDGGKNPADRIAILERFQTIVFGGTTANYAGCATGWAWSNLVRKELMYLSGGKPVFFRIASTPVAPRVGMQVGKTGRTTQLTTGHVTNISATVKVN